jgi:hypothetical protein
MTNNNQNPNLQTSKTGESLLGEGAEKYIRDTANIEDLPGDDDDLEIDEDDDDDVDDIDTVDYEEDVDDAETEAADDNAAIDAEEDEDYINKDEAKRDLRERGLRS